MNRRELTAAAIGLATARFLTPGRVEAGRGTITSRGADLFPLGVASGEPSADGFVLWTRLPGQATDLRVGFEIAEDEGFRRIVQTGRATAFHARGGAVHVEAAGLKAGRPYFYRFHHGEAVSRTGRTATLPRRPERLRLALTSCQHWEQGWFSAYADMMRANPAAVLQVGDYIYEKSFGHGPNVRAFGAPDPQTLADYRARHALYRTDAHLAAAHAAMPFIVTWDDHEVENDYGGEEGGVTSDPAAFLQRRSAAYQAYFEHMPLRPAALLNNGGVRLYRRFAFGDLATIHVLDSRQYRTPGPCRVADHLGGHVLEDCEAVFDPSSSMLGQEQEAWLINGLRNDRATWTVLAQQTLFSRLKLPSGPGARYSDIWDGYPATRDRIVAQLANRPGSVVLSGDVHSFWVNDVLSDFDRPDQRPVATEFVTSCLASRNGPEALFGAARRLNPHVRHLDNQRAGYILLDFDRRELAADLRAVDDLTDRSSLCRSVGRFVVDAGRPGARPADAMT
jgi:alkaline phosphatase D